MQYEINSAGKYSIATIKREKCSVVTAYLAVDVHESNTILNQATGILYPDALLSGTKTMTREEFLDKVNTLGASINVNFQNSVLTITLKSTSESFFKLLSLTEKMLLEPAFNSKELKRNKETSKNNLREEKENSKAVAHEELLNLFYDKTDRKYSYDIDDLIKTIDTVNSQEIKKLHNKILQNNWICSIAATEKINNEFKRTIQKLAKEYDNDVFSVKSHKQKNTRNELALKNIPSRQNIDFSIGRPIPFTLHHPDFLTLSFAISILAQWGGFAGRLMSTVREKEGLTYGIYGQLAGFSANEQGYMRIMTFFAPDKALQGLTSTFREINNIYKKGVSQKEVDKFKNILNTKQTLLNDSVGSLLMDMHAYHTHGFTVEEIEEHKARLCKITRKEVNEVIRKYLNPKELSISAAGPTDTVKKDLKSFLKKV